MKFTATLTFVIAMVSSSFTSTAQAAGLDALNGICENVATDNKSRFRKKIKESGLKLRDIYTAVSCEGKSLVRYSMAKNATSVGSYIVKRMPASHFAASGDLDWANTNGFATSPIVETISAR